jgi:hypothetical protein
MASRKAFNAMRNLPVKTFRAYEGTLTRYTGSVSPMGGVNEGAAVYSAPIAKGDLVKLYLSNADQGTEQVQKFAYGEGADYTLGIAVSDPQGIDNATASGGTPTYVYQRLVDVAVFGLAIIEIEAGGAVRPGYEVAMAEGENTVVEATAGTAVGSGRWVALGHYHDGDIAAILIGYAGLQVFD